MERIAHFFVALALATPLALAGPALPGSEAYLEADECGAFGGNLCKQVQTCWKVGTYSRCVTEYEYYPKEALREGA